MRLLILFLLWSSTLKAQLVLRDVWGFIDPKVNILGEYCYLHDSDLVARHPIAEISIRQSHRRNDTLIFDKNIFYACSDATGKIYEVKRTDWKGNYGSVYRFIDYGDSSFTTYDIEFLHPGPNQQRTTSCTEFRRINDSLSHSANYFCINDSLVSLTDYGIYNRAEVLRHRAAGEDGVKRIEEPGIRICSPDPYAKLKDPEPVEEKDSLGRTVRIVAKKILYLNGNQGEVPTTEVLMNYFGNTTLLRSVKVYDQYNETLFRRAFADPNKGWISYNEPPDYDPTRITYELTAENLSQGLPQKVTVVSGKDRKIVEVYTISAATR